MRTFKPTYPCLCCFYQTGTGEKMEERLLSLFENMHVLENGRGALIHFMKENRYLPESVLDGGSWTYPHSGDGVCYKSFLSSAACSDHMPCKLCARSAYYSNDAIDQEEVLIAYMLKDPRRFCEHFPKFNAEIFRSYYMFVYTGHTEGPRYAAIPLFRMLAKAVLNQQSRVEFKKAPSSVTNTMFLLKPSLTKMFTKEKTRFLYSELEPVLRDHIRRFDGPEFSMYTYDTLSDILKSLVSRRNRLKKTPYIPDSSLLHKVLGEPWEITIPGLIILDRKKVDAFSKPMSPEESEKIMDDPSRIKKMIEESGERFCDATADTKCVMRSSGEESQKSPVLLPSENLRAAAEQGSPVLNPHEKSTESDNRITRQRSFFEEEIPANGSERGSVEGVTSSVKQVHEDPMPSSKEVSRPGFSLGNQKKNTKPTKPAVIIPADLSSPDPVSEGMVGGQGGYDDYLDNLAQSEAASPAMEGNVPSENCGAPDARKEATSEDPKETTPVNACTDNCYSPYTGGTLTCNKHLKRLPCGALDVSEEVRNYLFPPLSNEAEAIDFLKHVLRHEDWFAAEYACDGTAYGIVLTGNRGYHAAFLGEQVLTKTVCKLLFSPQSPKMVYTQSLPYLYSMMIRNGFYTPLHLESLPAHFYADGQWSPFSTYPDLDLMDLLSECQENTGEVSLMEFLGHYKRFCEALVRRNDTGARACRIRSSRYRHYELALGTMKGTDRFPGCAWYPVEATETEISSFPDQGNFFEVRIRDGITRDGKPLCDEEHFYFLMGVVARVQRECFSKYPVNLITMKPDYLVYYIPTRRPEDRAYFENLVAGEFAHVKRDMKTDPPSIRISCRPIRQQDSLEASCTV